MTRSALTALTTCLLLALALACTAAAAPPRPDDFARGSGVAADGFRFEFSASSGLNGGTATGTMFDEGPRYSIRAEVRCLHVSGLRATVAGVVTESEVPEGQTGALGTSMYMVVEDRARRGAHRDRLESFFGGTEDPCIADFTGVEVPEIISGDVTVRDCVALSRNGKRCAKTRGGPR